MTNYRELHAFEADVLGLGSSLCVCGLPKIHPLHELEHFRDGTREGDQDPPEVNDHPIIQELVQQDLEDRLQLGIKRYGTGLQPHNGRDMLKDAYEEAMDLVVYLRGCLYERDGQ